MSTTQTGGSGTDKFSDDSKEAVGEDGVAQPVQQASSKKQRRETFDKYKPPWRVMFLEVLALLLLMLFTFLPPNSSGGVSAIAQVQSDGEAVGVLRSCTGSACDSWMAGATSPSSSSSSSSSTATTRSLEARAASQISSIINLSTFYLTTGLATLAAFYLLLYTFLFTLYRKVRKAPIRSEDNPPDTKLGWEQGLKRLAYRLCRCFLPINAIMSFAITLDCGIKSLKVRSGLKLSGTDGTGNGIGVIAAVFILLLVITLMELSTKDKRIHRFLHKTPGLCANFSCCSSGNRNAASDAERGESGENREDSRSRRIDGSRNRGRSGGRGPRS
ncbi:hypothetical protein BCR39DRAFT_559617 [Naematelia encephala]|uniref:Transmembrane protein n=1 Tax=Naematelia encephala TaxID=71784 RepID=A0A1Y2B0F4_9TREE|nr:hypothetical protein BCR39DRAFT_559617 [Naematelia encephala]